MGSSAALVCQWCRFTVVRSDRDLRAIGKVADLVPTAPVMAVGDIGTVGSHGFRVAGRLQLDHGKGPWDEWYVALDEGAAQAFGAAAAASRWGWLAKAQGKWYLTFPVEAQGLPAWEHMTPGNSGNLPGTGPTQWTAVERGQSTLVSAEGELPFPAVSGQPGRYVDLQGPNGAFGTIDYGDGREPPKLYAGGELAADQIKFQQTAVGPRPVEKIEVQRLRCPTCGGPVPILVPSQTERAACAACNSLLDFNQGNLQLLRQLQQPRVVPIIPLGTEGTLRGQKLLCIALMERTTVVEGITYAWREYLLHSDAGFRWLLEDNFNWTFISPANAGDVKIEGSSAVFSGRRHKLFSRAHTRVRFVIGELYWKVEVGEQAVATDFIAPPHTLSEERTNEEVVWSQGEYIEPKEIWAAFKLPGSPRRPTDVAPAQPNPVRVMPALAYSAIFAALIMGIFFLTRREGPEIPLVQGPIAMPPYGEAQMAALGMGTATAAPTAMAISAPSFTPQFTVPPGTRLLAIKLTTNIAMGWVGVACALINDATGEYTEVSLEQDRFRDGSTSDAVETTYVEVPAGVYTLRADPHWARMPGSMNETVPPTAMIEVATSNGSPGQLCCCLAIFMLLLPVPVQIMRRGAFENRRWQASNL